MDETEQFLKNQEPPKLILDKMDNLSSTINSK